MHLMLGLTCVVNDGRLVGSLDWLTLWHGKVYCLLKTLLAQVVHPSTGSTSTVPLSCTLIIKIN